VVKITAVLPTLLMLAACTTINLNAPVTGKVAVAGVAIKGYVVIGDVSASSTETHKISPFGFVRKVEGAKITYCDLMQEAARINADDIIDVRIDINTNGKTTFIDWLKGWERCFTYTGSALAVKYTNFRDFNTANTEPVKEDPPEPKAIDFLYR